MSTPPPGGWQPQNSGQPPYGSPQYGPPPGGFPPYPGQQPGYAPGQGPQGPPPPRNYTKWLLGVIAVLLVVGVTIGATLLFSRNDGPSTPPAPGTPSDVASADDTGPVSIIMDDPTCKPFNPINLGLADIQAQGWGAAREALGPASDWTPEQRQQVEAVAQAMRNAADETVRLARQTPHRVMREIYEQFIVYGRAYADSVESYTPADNGLASANVNASSAIVGICNAIEYGSAGRSLGLQKEGAPSQTEQVSDPDEAQPFITGTSTVCNEWVSRLDQFNSTTPEWQQRDGNVSASQWTPERRAIEEAAAPLLVEYAEAISKAGRDSGNPVLEDLSVLASLYIRGYVEAGNSYTSADSWLAFAGFRIANMVAGACRAVSG